MAPSGTSLHGFIIVGLLHYCVGFGPECKDWDFTIDLTNITDNLLNGNHIIMIHATYLSNVNMTQFISTTILVGACDLDDIAQTNEAMAAVVATFLSVTLGLPCLACMAWKGKPPVASWRASFLYLKAFLLFGYSTYSLVTCFP